MAELFAAAQREIRAELDQIRADGLFKTERVIVSPQGSSIRVDAMSNVAP